MIKSLHLFLPFTILSLINSCISQPNSNKVKNDSTGIIKHIDSNYSFQYKNLATWVSHSGSHFEIVEVKDSLNATVYTFENWFNSFNNVRKEKTAYSKMDGRITKWDQYSLAIQTKRFHFYYQIEMDALLKWLNQVV